MKILILNNRYKFKGGEGAVVSSEVEMLKGFGHDVSLFESSNENIKDFPLLQKLHFLIKDMVWSEENYNTVKRLIKRKRPDIAHIHNTFFMLSPSVYYALSEEGIPIVQALHNYRLFCPKGVFYRDGKVCEACSRGNFTPAAIYKCWNDSFILTLSLIRMLKFHSKRKTFQNTITSYIVASEFTKNKFVELGLTGNKIFLKPHFIDLKVEDRENRENYALFIGRLTNYKGINSLMSAYRIFPNYHLKIIGDGPLFTKLKEKAKKMNNIKILGRVSDNEKFEYLKKASFLIFPSECYENMPRILIEAFACGIPVIASYLGSMIEFIKDGQTGLHFTPRDSSELASKIKWAVDNPGQMKKMGKAARKEYEEKYTAEKNYEILMSIYKETIKNYNLQ